MRVTKKKQPPSSQPASPVQPPRRLETGVPRLDYILKGGLFTGSTYALMGPPGSGHPTDRYLAILVSRK